MAKPRISLPLAWQPCHLLASLFGTGQRLPDLSRFVESNLGGLLILALNRFVDFAAVHRDLAWRFDTQSDFVATNVDDRYDDVITYNDALVALSRKDEHSGTPR
jgi:hypothetical protein